LPRSNLWRSIAVLFSLGLVACQQDVTPPQFEPSFDRHDDDDDDDCRGVPSWTSDVRGSYTVHIGDEITIKTKTTTKPKQLQWWSTNCKVATVDEGKVKARSSGTVLIKVSGAKGVKESYTVSVMGPEVVDFVLTPSEGPPLMPGQVRQFKTRIEWSDNKSRAAKVTYRATAGTISETGLFTAGSVAGRSLVIASCDCGVADTAAVDVTASAPLLSKLSISPKAVSLAAGGGQQFATTALWSTGATTLPPVTYRAIGGTVGATTGLYLAPTTAGTYLVIVSHTGGTSQDTATITVGGGIGTTPSAVNVLFRDGFESGGFTTAQNGISWTSKPWVFASTILPRTGTRSAQFRQGDSKTGGELRFGGLPNLPEVYIQFWLYQPNGTETPSLGPRVSVPVDGKNDKFFRLWSGTYASSLIKYGASTWGAGGVGYIGSEFMINSAGTMLGMGQGGTGFQTSPKLAAIGADAYVGRWVQVRIRSKVASAANNNGVIQIWFNGALLVDKRNLPSYAAGGVGNFFQSGYLLGWANSTFNPETNMFIDDVTISTGGFPAQ
jgi:hypothetical protein